MSEHIQNVPDYRIHLDPTTGEIRVQGAKLLVSDEGPPQVINNTSVVLYPGDDIAGFPDSVRKVAKAFWTPGVVKEGQARRKREGDGSALLSLRNSSAA